MTLAAAAPAAATPAPDRNHRRPMSTCRSHLFMRFLASFGEPHQSESRKHAASTKRRRRNNVKSLRALHRERLFASSDASIEEGPERRTESVLEESRRALDWVVTVDERADIDSDRQVVRLDQLPQVGHHFPLIALERSKESLVSRREPRDRFKCRLATVIGEPNLIGARIAFGRLASNQSLCFQ